MPRLLLPPSPSFAEFGKQDTEQSIVARFEQQVLRHAGRTALKTHRAALTYTELQRRAHAVARAIRARRGNREEPIALLIDQKAPLIAAILGVLAAGKFYVPLDPAYPQARNRYILEDSQAGLLVTDEKNAALASELASRKTPLLSVDDVDSCPIVGDPGITIAPGALAYILYTSGSTGQPKGVMQTHRNVLHNVMKYTNCARIHAEDRLSLLSSCSFGASVSDLFGALLNGACLHPFDLKQEGVDQLANWLIQEEITIYHSVPTVYRHFVDSLRGGEEFPRLRLIKLGGERVSRQDVERYRRCFAPECILYVGLGATEMNIIRRILVDRQTEFAGSTVPVGYAVEDTEVLLLDEGGAVVGLNTIGEIAIRSRYLSPGYWRRPDLTQAAFLPDPGGESEPVFRTGDLGRMLPDGCLLHLGRKDGQVKIRGHRIELSEIEMALLAHGMVREAIVVADEDRHGEQRLVAYVVLDTPASGREWVSELCRFLKEKLPDYMLPAVFVPLPALPLLPNGKVDRRALPAPEPASSGLAGAVVAPRDPLERELTRIWEKVMRLPSVGIQDSFFDLGGHSLLAARLLANVEKVSGKRLSLATLLRAPTIERMARLLREEGGRDSPSSLVAIQAGGTRPPFFCVHNATGHVLSYRELAQHLGADQPVYGLQAPGLEGRWEIPARVEDLAAHYLAEIRRLQPAGPYYLGGHSSGGIIAFEMAQQLHTQGQRVAVLALFDTSGPGASRAAWRHRLGVHLDLLARMEPGDKLTYMLERGSAVREKIHWWMWRQGHRASAGLGRPLPSLLRNMSLVNRQAAREYRPQLYAGRLIIFRATGRSVGEVNDPENGWSGLAAEGVEIYEVPGSHESLMHEPHVKILTAQLNDCLRQAQAGKHEMSQHRAG